MKIIDIKELSREIGMSTFLIRRSLKDGLIPYLVIGQEGTKGCKYLFDLDLVEEKLRAKMEESQSKN